MRRTTLTLLLALLAAAALSTSALAKEGGVELSSTPYGSKPGDPWTGTMNLVGVDQELLAQARPSITITNLTTAEQQVFRGIPTADPAVWDFSVLFPEAGRYAVDVGDGVTGRSYGYPPVQIGPAASTSNAPTVAGDDGGGGGFPVLPLAGGLALLLAALASAGYVLRRERLAHGH